MNKTRKVFLLVVCIFAAGILCLYLGAAFYYQDRFLPNTFINEQEFSNMTPDEADELISDDVLSYTLTIIDRDGNKEHILPTEYNLTYTSNGEIRNIRESQNPFLWFLSLFKTSYYTAEIHTSYDSALLNERISQLTIFQNQEVILPQDAYIDYTDGRYVIIPEIYGNQLDSDRINQEIIAAIDTKLTKLDLKEYQLYDSPAITSDNEELIAELNSLNEILDLTITYQFGSQERVLEGSTIRNWLDTDGDGEVTVNSVYVDDYVLSLAKEFNTFGSTREFTTSGGEKIDIVGGDYGWIINKSATAAELIEIIKSGESQTLEPIYEATAATHDGIDTGEPNTYVEIDLTNQHLWYYENGVLMVESDIVSGTKNNENRATREGTFAVMFKDTDYRLTGEGWDTPVDYFIAFYTNVGLHDASWRSSFGGKIFETNGSHGCINMPRDKVAEIYETISVGTIVYTYY